MGQAAAAPREKAALGFRESMLLSIFNFLEYSFQTQLFACNLIGHKICGSGFPAANLHKAACTDRGWKAAPTISKLFVSGNMLRLTNFHPGPPPGS
jgi:hypothetical protein